MIKSLYKKIMFVQILVQLSVSVASVIDNIIVGKFLGVVSIAGCGLVMPITMIFLAISNVLGTGCQLKCSEKLGANNIQEANKIMTLSVYFILIFSAVLMTVVLVFMGQICQILGAQPGTELYSCARSYLSGFVIGAPAFIGVFVLTPFMQLDGDRSRTAISMLSITVSDIVFDLVAILVFHGGLFSIGLASSLSYYVGLCIMSVHFIKKKGTFRIVREKLPWKQTGSIIGLGSSAALQSLLRMAMILTGNRLVLMVAGDVYLGIHSAVFSAVNFFGGIGQGMGAATLVIGGVLYGEHDQNAITKLLKSASFYAIILNTVVITCVFIFARPIASLFVQDSGDILAITSMSIRIMCIGILPYAFNLIMKNYYQSIHNLKLTYLNNILEVYVCVVGAMFLLSKVWGYTGILIGFPVGETFVFLVFYIITAIHEKKLPKNFRDFLMLPVDFCVALSERLDLVIHTVEEAVDASRRAEKFVKQKDSQQERSIRYIIVSLCIEELTTNVVLHGFDEKKHNHLEVRLIHQKEDFILSIRDDCQKFDPIEYMKMLNSLEVQSTDSVIGLKMITKLVKNIQYLNTLGLNNVNIRL